MTINVNFANLETHVQDKFIAIARKDPEARTAAEWFEHLVPEPLQDSSHETEVFMDGGTVTQDVWVYDQGTNGGHWETVEHTIGDRDVSRIEAGVNGGEYTHDNTIMVDSSINRSRGGEDMTSGEFEAATEANTVDADLIDGSVDTVIESTTEAGEFVSAVSDTVADAIAPVVGALLVGKTVANKFEKPIDKVGWGSLASGGGALLCTTPVGQAGLALYGIFSLGKLAIRATRFIVKHA